MRYADLLMVQVCYNFGRRKICGGRLKAWQEVKQDPVRLQVDNNTIVFCNQCLG